MNNPDNSTNNRLYAGLLIWFLINLVQAIFTEINPDEAYYAFWSEQLDWGYYDHPPMVAFIIRISSLLFSGNLGTRFMTLILQPLTLLITWKLCETNDNVTRKKQLVVFFMTAAAMTMMVAYGFITTPDTPLLFFTALFLYGYKQFLVKNDFLNSLLLAFAMSGLIYSKYQGGIIILLLLISNLRLLKNPYFILAGTLALLLSLPHFYWQIKNNFPSFQYHLVGRSKEFKWNYFFEYIPNQLATFNPFVFVAMIWVVVKYRVTDSFERALTYIMVGLVSFFWLVTFRGHAEPHWTVAASIPALILIVNYSKHNQKFNDYLKRFVGASLILILLIRIVLMTNLLPSKLELSGKKANYEAIEKIADTTPVIFTGSFQSPSLYHFFTGNKTTVISSIYTRKTQYDIWRKDRDFQGKKVFLVGEYGTSSKEYNVNNQILKGLFIDSFQNTKDISISFQGLEKIYSAGEKINVAIEIKNNGNFPIGFHHPQLPVSILAILSGKNTMEIIDGHCSKEIERLNAHENTNLFFEFILPKLKLGEYKLGFSCNNITGPDYNSEWATITLTK